MTVTFEQPLNERIRAFLRADFLFRQLAHTLCSQSTWDTRTTINTMVDILSIFNRADLKTEIIKELDRLSTNLSIIEKRPGVDHRKLSQILYEINLLLSQIHEHPGQIGANLRQNEFICSITQRSSIPGGTCDFDLPGYHLWLQCDSEKRINDIQNWMQEFNTIRTAIRLILKILRDSAEAETLVAENGFFQQSLAANVPFQLVRVMLPENSAFYAEISGGKHRFSIRFLEMSLDERPRQTEASISFSLAVCAI